MRIIIVALLVCIATMAVADPKTKTPAYNLSLLPQPVVDPSELVQLDMTYVLTSEMCEDGSPQLQFPPKEVTGEITQVFGSNGILILKTENFPEFIETEYWFENGYLYNVNVSSEEPVPSTLIEEDGKLIWYSILPLDKDSAARICPPGNRFVKTTYELKSSLQE